MSWMPIETAPTNEWVLVLDGIGDVCAAHHQFGYWYAWFDYVGEDLKLTGVTHWQALPEPPES